MTQRSRRSSRTIGYWTATGLVTSALLMGGAADALHWHPTAEGMTRLGYPMYFLTILGLWKIAGVAALLWPGFRLVKEWAYAGVFFLLTGALVSHAVCGEWTLMIAPLVLVVLTVASWMLRPRDRMLGVPAASTM